MKVSLGVYMLTLLCMQTVEFAVAKPTRDPLPIATMKNVSKSENRAVLPIKNYGGPVIKAPVVYLIWYGKWTGNTAVGIITTFVQNLGKSAWWDINIKYGVTTPLRYGGSATDNYSSGTYLSEDDIQTITETALNGKLKYDPNGIYLVLTSEDVFLPGFYTDYCGWHYYYKNSNEQNVIYGFVGNPGSWNWGCIAQYTTPNNNVGADSMISVIAHELTEAATDPLLNAWHDSEGYENADKCAWKFGQTKRATNGASYNLALGSKKYLVQQNWRYPAQSCGMTP